VKSLKVLFFFASSKNRGSISFDGVWVLLYPHTIVPHIADLVSVDRVVVHNVR